MANLSEHGYGYNAVSQKDKTREEREESLYRDCERNLASHKKTKEQLSYCIIAVWAFCMIIQAYHASNGMHCLNRFAFQLRVFLSSADSMSKSLDGQFR